MPDNIKHLAKLIKKADAIVITAGAGIGVDSGLPDFRGNTGFWKAYPPIAKLGLSFSEMANPEWFERLPKFAWAFYGHRLNLYRKTMPHQGFYQLLEIAKTKPLGYFVYTSNVDGQFQKAGYTEDYIEECHGSIHHLQCTKPCCSDIWPAFETDIIVNETIFEAQQPLPLCPNCGALARPNILMFGDWSWLCERTNEQSQAFAKWLSNVEQNNGKLVVIELGAGKSVATVRRNSEHLVSKYQANLIRINPRDYDVPAGQYFISAGAKVGINLLYQEFIKFNQ